MFCERGGQTIMLLQFNVTNAFSFKKEMILDMVAGADNSHSENLIHFDNQRILPTVAIYGANAAGKSNVFKALTSAIMFVRTSSNMQINSRIGITPFLMDEESRAEKTRFDFIFTYKGVKYEYGFTADTMKVYEEYLYVYKTQKPSMVFERENVEHYNYTEALKPVLEPYKVKTAANKLFLSTATAWNCKETADAFMWFAEMIDTYNSDSVQNTMAEALDSPEKEEIRAFAKKYLKAADSNIADYIYEVKKGAPEDLVLPPGITFDEKTLVNMKQWQLTMCYDVTVNGKKIKVNMPFDTESDGTKLYFAYCPSIYQALKKGKTITIDGINDGLHPMLVQYIVDLFNDPETNPHGAQLIFNTHDVELLNLDILRRDQIYFVEKDNKTGESDLYALSDFSPRKTENIQRGYMLGRYGAIPNIGGMEW